MAQLCMRYGGQIHTIDDGPNYNPQSYGTKRLKVRVNSSKTLEFGLTTNTNAKEYCELAVRVGGQIAYIGRVSSTNYESGQTPDRKGSTVASSSTKLLSRNSASTSSISYVLFNSQIPHKTITNATGSTVLNTTKSEYYSAASGVSCGYMEWKVDYRTSYISYTQSMGFPSLGTNKSITYSRSTRVTMTRRTYIKTEIAAGNYRVAFMNSLYSSITNKTSYSSVSSHYGSTVSTTRWIKNTSNNSWTSSKKTESVSTNAGSSAWLPVPNQIVTEIYTNSSFSQTFIGTLTQNGSVYSTASTTYFTKRFSTVLRTYYTTPQSYWTTSKSSIRIYSYNSSSYSLYTNISETLHNINL